MGDEIVIGGEFERCQGQECRNIVRLNRDGDVLSTYGSGADDTVNVLTVDVGGRVWVGGDFEEFEAEFEFGLEVGLNR